MVRGLIFILLLFSISAFAQVERWTYFNDHLGQETAATNICVMSDTSYTLVSTISGQPGAMLITKLSAAGDSLWNRQYHFPGFIRTGTALGAQQRTDGTCLYAFALSDSTPRSSQLFCYSPSGDSLWTKNYGLQDMDDMRTLDLLNDGGAILGGSIDEGVWSYVIRVNEFGDTVWTQTYDTLMHGVFSVKESLDGGFVFGSYWGWSPNEKQMVILKADSVGNFMWKQEHGYPWQDGPGRVNQLSDSTFIMSANVKTCGSGNSCTFPALYRLDQLGNELWHVVYDDDTLSWVKFNTMPIVTKDKGYAILGLEGAIGNNSVLFRADSSGNELWRRYYSTGHSITNYLSDLHTTVDGGFIMAGFGRHPITSDYNSWVVKVDSTGCLVPGCDVLSVQEHRIDLSDLVSISPNPAEDHIKIELDGGINLNPGTNVDLSIVSTEGQVVNKVSTSLTKVQGCKIPVGGLPSGMYYLHFSSNDTWFAGAKFIVN